MLDWYYSLSCWKCLNVAETVLRVFIIDLLSCCRANFQSQLVEEGCTILCLVFCSVFHSGLCLCQHFGYLIKPTSTGFYKPNVQVVLWVVVSWTDKRSWNGWEPSRKMYKWVLLTQFGFGNAFQASKCGVQPVVISSYVIQCWVPQHLHFLSVFPIIENYLFNIGGDKFL